MTAFTWTTLVLVAVLFACVNVEALTNKELRRAMLERVASKQVLGKIATLKRTATANAGISKLPGGQYIFTAGVATDCDGWASCRAHDPDGQSSTSWNFGGRPVDANRAPYFVLPLPYSPSNGPSKFPGVKLGDIAAVVRGNTVVFAVFADNGPSNKLGEGSLALVEMLGHNPWRGARCTGRIATGIPSGVTFVIFPGSKSSVDIYNYSALHAKGAALWTPLAGSAPPTPPARTPCPGGAAAPAPAPAPAAANRNTNKNTKRRKR